MREEQDKGINYLSTQHTRNTNPFIYFHSCQTEELKQSPKMLRSIFLILLLELLFIYAVFLFSKKKKHFNNFCCHANEVK